MKISNAARLLAASSILLQSCAITPTPEQEEYFREYAGLLRDEPVSLIFDGCVIRDEVGADYVLRRASEEISGVASHRAIRLLQANGYEVAGHTAPFLCGALASGDVGEPRVLEVAERVGEDRTEKVLPLVQHKELSTDPELAAAYQAIIQQAMMAVPWASKESLSRQGKSTPIALDFTHADLLKDALKTNFVWVITAGGAQVSTGKSIGTAIMTGLLSAGLSGGMVIATHTSVPGNGYNSALINLGEGTLVWKKHSRGRPGDPADSKIYNAKWAQELFLPFLEISQIALAPSEMEAENTD